MWSSWYNESRLNVIHTINPKLVWRLHTKWQMLMATRNVFAVSLWWFSQATEAGVLRIWADTAKGHTSRVCVCDVHTIWYPFRAEVIEHLLWEENAHYTWNKRFILSKNSNNTKISRYLCPYNMLIYFGEYHFVCLCVCVFGY